jgi:hypothetical protein
LYCIVLAKGDKKLRMMSETGLGAALCAVRQVSCCVVLCLLYVKEEMRHTQMRFSF